MQDARRVCEQLQIPLHHANFSAEYRERVFRDFLDEYNAGRTPNPDVLCNREIKFGAFREYAKRLGAELLATGHYARIVRAHGETHLIKGKDTSKDQSYFLHAVSAAALSETVFPLGELDKSEVRAIARDHGLATQDKKDSTGICFIGERPFREFLSAYVPGRPGPIRTPEGHELGEHVGLAFYTLGQRQGLGVGGRRDAGEQPWYVADKNVEDNTLIVVQGDHPLLFSHAAEVSALHWIGPEPEALATGLTCQVKVRYRQPDQDCHVTTMDAERVRVDFTSPQRAVAPGQYAVFYAGERCLGGGVIDRRECSRTALRTAV